MTSSNDNVITYNRKAKHDYHIYQTFEAGLVLMGWEVKSARKNTVQLKESYVVIKHGEAFLWNAHFSVPSTTSTHVEANPIRSRKLLLHQKELDKLIGQINQKGFTIVPLMLYWKKNKIKLEIALSKGKKLYDKRATKKEQEWKRIKDREFKKSNENS